MLRITPAISIPESELDEQNIRASGPGGQKVNKTATAVKLRFDVKNSSSLPGEVRGRLMLQQGNRINKDGTLIIDARRFRTREQNRQDARRRLAGMIRESARRPRARLKTSPTLASRKKRLDKKRRRGEIKRWRGPVFQNEVD